MQRFWSILWLNYDRFSLIGELVFDSCLMNKVFNDQNMLGDENRFFIDSRHGFHILGMVL